MATGARWLKDHQLCTTQVHRRASHAAFPTALAKRLPVRGFVTQEKVSPSGLAPVPEGSRHRNPGPIATISIVESLDGKKLVNILSLHILRPARHHAGLDLVTERHPSEIP